MFYEVIFDVTTDYHEIFSGDIRFDIRVHTSNPISINYFITIVQSFKMTAKIS